MAQPVRALFLIFKDSPCQEAVDTALLAAEKNGWATQVYYLDSVIDPPSTFPYPMIFGLRADSPHLCTWLLEKVLQNAVAQAQRDHAQLFVFCGGYGTSPANEAYNAEMLPMMHGTPIQQGVDPAYVNHFNILDVLAASDRECIVVMHTSISRLQLQHWYNSHKEAGVHVILFHEPPYLQASLTWTAAGTINSHRFHTIPFQHQEEALDGLSYLILTCRQKKLQLNQALEDKLASFGLNFTTTFTGTKNKFSMSACDTFENMTKAESKKKYKQVSLFLLAFAGEAVMPDPPIDKRLAALGNTFQKRFRYQSQLVLVPTNIAPQDVGMWVLKALHAHVKHHHNVNDEALLVFCYAGHATVQGNDLRAWTNNELSTQSFSLSGIDAIFREKVKCDVLQILDCDDASQLEKTDVQGDRIVETLTGDDRATFLDRVIGQLIYRADGNALPFTVGQLKEDLKAIFLSEKDRRRKMKSRRKSTVGQTQESIVLSKLEEPPESA